MRKTNPQNKDLGFIVAGVPESDGQAVLNLHCSLCLNSLIREFFIIRTGAFLLRSLILLLLYHYVRCTAGAGEGAGTGCENFFERTPFF